MNRLVSIFCTIVISVVALAQPNGTADKKCQHPNCGQDRMQSEKIAFITRVVDLTPEEAQVFWPVYNQIEQQQKELFKAERDAYKALHDAQNSGKGDINALLTAYLSAKAANVNQHAVNIEKYKKILPVEKVARFFTSEEQFRRELIGQLRYGRPADNKPGDRPSGKQYGRPSGKPADGSHEPRE